MNILRRTKCIPTKLRAKFSVPLKTVVVEKKIDYGIEPRSTGPLANALPTRPMLEETLAQSDGAVEYTKCISLEG